MINGHDKFERIEIVVSKETEASIKSNSAV